MFFVFLIIFVNCTLVSFACFSIKVAIFFLTGLSSFNGQNSCPLSSVLKKIAPGWSLPYDLLGGGHCDGEIFLLFMQWAHCFP